MAGASLSYFGRPATLVIGFVAGVLAAVATVWWSLRIESKRSARELLYDAPEAMALNPRASSRLWLVGGTILSNGNQTVTGAIITGLNIKLGIAVPKNTLGNGNKTFQFDSCDIQKAMTPFAGWQRMGNATVDNWPSY